MESRTTVAAEQQYVARQQLRRSIQTTRHLVSFFLLVTRGGCCGAQILDVLHMEVLSGWIATGLHLLVAESDPCLSPGTALPWIVHQLDLILQSDVSGVCII